MWVNCLKSLKKPSIYLVGKTPSAPSVKRYLRHPSRNCFHATEFPPFRQAARVLLELGLVEILDYSLEVNQDRCHPIRVDH